MVLLGRRSFIRADIEAQLFLRRIGEDWEKVTCKDISIDGLAFCAAAPLTLEEPIEIALPDDWGRQLITARVVHIHDDIIGCQFIDLSPELAQVLSRIVYSNWQQSLRRTTSSTDEKE
ncbi:MAG TPA: PilZ domain-containing protein [Desulfitobacteriaceae bacterium]|nr:PilZ domain-containing protein [Desulfitobacteriaceae bacterium]